MQDEKEKLLIFETKFIKKQSKIPSSDHTNSKLSNFPDCQAVPIATEVLTGNFLLLLFHLGCTTKEGSIPFEYFLHLLVEGYQGPLLFPGVFTAEEVEGEGDNTSTDNTTVGGLFEHIPVICLYQ